MKSCLELLYSVYRLIPLSIEFHMTSRRHRIRILLVIISVTFVVVYAILSWWPLDGISGVFASMFSREDTTVYAPGYTDQSFRKIEIGMDRREVYDLLGNPIRKTELETQNKQLEEWSYSPNDSDFRRREIIFRDGVVVDKNAEYWLD